MAAFPATLWRWISGILGVTGLLLMTTLGIMLKNCHKTLIKTTIFPGTFLEIQKDSGYSSCQERWIGYQCSCYFISSDLKTWEESREFCISQNSTLLQMHKKDELHFMKSNLYFYWIGINYSAEHDTWMWLNGSPVSHDLFSFFQSENSMNCVAYSPSNDILHESCQNKNLYICKKQLI